jgi:hypothetical protein
MDLKSDGLKKYHEDLKSGKIKKAKTIDPIQKAKKYPKSLRSAINAKCFDCCCGMRNEVILCRASDCPLHHLRPWQKKA